MFYLLLFIGITFLTLVIRGIYIRSNKYACKKGFHKVSYVYGYRPPTNTKASELHYSYGIIRKYCKVCNTDLP